MAAIHANDLRAPSHQFDQIVPCTASQIDYALTIDFADQLKDRGSLVQRVESRSVNPGSESLTGSTVVRPVGSHRHNVTKRPCKSDVLFGER